MLRVSEDLHCSFRLIKTKERIWIILLEGLFEFHENVHEENMKRRSLIGIGLQNRKEEKKEFKHEILDFVFKVIYDHFVLSNEE